MDGQHRHSLPLLRFNRRKETTTLRGPLKVFRLCLLSILLPCLLIAGPLYLRYRVFSEQVYPVGMSDMRLVDNKISTTWCQKQLVKSNATFSAYLLPEEPQVKPNPLHVSTVKYLTLEDDMKEYWGFYLLKGSSVTVSTCCRWPGASLIVIKGYKHLRDCAYIGDDSSEELEEVEEFNKQETEKRRDYNPKGRGSDLWPLRKARDKIEFYGSHEILSQDEFSKTAEDEENVLPSLQQNTKIPERSSTLRPINTKEENQAVEQNLEITKNSEELYQDIARQITALGNRSSSVMSKLRKIFKFESNEGKKLTVTGINEKEERLMNNSRLSKTVKREITLWSLQKALTKDSDTSDAAEEKVTDARDDIRGTINGTTLNDMSNSEFWSSFSSSEERLLSCAGLILNLPLTPSKSCDPKKSQTAQAKASLTNKLTYKVPTNGYYFFVFSSENEIQPNYIRIHFHLEKMLYNVSNSVAACTNTTDSCSLPLNFFSSEKVVLEMPININETLWNQEYVVISVCEPRTMIYAACVIAVPILILLFAF